MRLGSYLGGAALCLGLLGCGGAGGGAASLGRAESNLGVLAAPNDLTVAYIRRLPALSWVWDSANPKVEGWPAVGQQVTWRGYIRNFSATPRNAVRYAWYWDGAQVASGTVDLPAGGTASVDYARAWDFTRHALKLVIDTNNAVAEDEEQNNDVTIASDALALGLWVEQSVYDYFLAHQRELVGAHSISWDNWAQRQVSQWNDVLYAGAVYPETPNGVLDRVRLDEIVIVPDGVLPISGGLPTNDPDLNDHTVDLEWGFPATELPPSSSFYADTTTVSLENPFYYEKGLIHELGHARYLIDDYGFNVHQKADGSGRDGIPQTENGAGIVGSPFLPMVSDDAVYYTHQSGLMNGDNYFFVDRYSAAALNLIAGHRAIEGNANAPGNLGAFINDLPPQNRVTLFDAANDAPLAGAQVRIYQAHANGQLYGKNFDAAPSQVLIADASGNVLVGRNPFSSESLTGWHGNTTLLMRVEHQGRVRYVFMEASDYNLEFWRGHTSLGTYTVSVAFQPGAVVHSNRILGFENAGDWSASAGTLSNVSSPVTEGAAALQVAGVGYTILRSAAVSSQGVSVGGKVAFDILLPQFENGTWYGQVQVYLNAPSRGIYDAYVGSQNLSGLPLETYNTITMTLPPSLATSLRAGAFDDLTIKIVLDLPSGSGRHLLDNFRFLP
jgi:CARDB